MNEKNDSLRAPLTFLIGVLLLEGLLAVLAGLGLFWGGVLLFILISIIQIVTLILIWYVFRLVVRVNERVTTIEEQTRHRASNKSSEATQ